MSGVAFADSPSCALSDSPVFLGCGPWTACIRIAQAACSKSRLRGAIPDLRSRVSAGSSTQSPLSHTPQLVSRSAKVRELRSNLADMTTLSLSFLFLLGVGEEAESFLSESEF